MWYNVRYMNEREFEIMWISDGWKDYRLVDSGGGEKLEYWGDILLRRPEPQAIWERCRDDAVWKKADAVYHRSNSGGGKWEIRNKAMPEKWQIKYGELVLNVKPMGFKHTGLFPEQAANWDWFSELIKKEEKPVRVLNLFAYTGGATAAALCAGAEVVHVDASKGMVTYAKENVASSGLADRSVRYMVDDVKKFVAREIRRGRQYEGIIMDPPSYGRGPSGELWKIEDELYPLLCACAQLLSDRALFFLINTYASSITQTVLENSVRIAVGEKFGGRVAADEIGLAMQKRNMALPCGISCRWQR